MARLLRKQNKPQQKNEFYLSLEENADEKSSVHSIHNPDADGSDRWYDGIDVCGGCDP